MDPTRPHRLENPVQHYEWGSRSAIPELLGLASPAAKPCAELWMGAHRRGTSDVVCGDERLPLDAFIAQAPEAVLGAEVAARYGGALPFLFKVLAADAPLSIQAHPSLEQARAGFARENASGVALDDENRCYPDDNHKPELICALTPFEALDRFRPVSEILAGFERLAAPALEPLLAALRARPERLDDFFRALWQLEEGPLVSVLSRAAEQAQIRAEHSAAFAWVGGLLDRYPGDVGALAPLLLNLVELAPGEALYLPAGELHSYLRGVGVELMANSDNVLRGGLTPKPVHVPELMASLSFQAGPVEVLRPEPASPGEGRYATPAAEFALSVLEATPASPVAVTAGHGVEILLCTSGEGRLAGPGECPLRRGDCVLVPASAPGYRVEGRIALHRAGVGPAPQSGLR